MNTKQEKIISLVDGNKTATEIAGLVQSTPDYVRKVVDKFGLSKKLKSRRQGNWAKVAALLDGTVTAKEAAERTGVSLRTVYQVACYKKLPLRRSVRRQTLEFLMAKGLPKQVVEWLVATTPKGANVNDMICAIIIDAFNEETQE